MRIFGLPLVFCVLGLISSPGGSYILNTYISAMFLPNMSK